MAQTCMTRGSYLEEGGRGGPSRIDEWKRGAPAVYKHRVQMKVGLRILGSTNWVVKILEVAAEYLSNSPLDTPFSLIRRPRVDHPISGELGIEFCHEPFNLLRAADSDAELLHERPSHGIRSATCSDG